jgi:glycosyltransferase involved in cell wall biosynthesis
MRNSPGRTPTVCMVATVPAAFTAYMAAHIRVLRHSCRITIVTTGSNDALASLCTDGVTCLSLRISRGISLIDDVKAVVALYRLFRRERYDVVHSLTPKGGLLAMVAARAAGVPVRVHWFWGQVWATKRGAWRWLLKTMDRVLAACSTHLLADSRAQADFLTTQGVVRPGQVRVLGHGSVCGVDLDRFRPDPVVRCDVRQRLDIPGNALVALYLGRLNPEKGLPELAEAFALAAPECPRLFLLIVGPDETNMRALMTRTAGDRASHLRFVDWTDQPEQFMAASDLFVLPSHREGFGQTVIEAAACGIPSIGTRIYGLTDTVDDETGILVPVGDVMALRDALVRLATDDDLRLAMGGRAKARAEGVFAQPLMTEALLAYYGSTLGVTQP